MDEVDYQALSDKLSNVTLEKKLKICVECKDKPAIYWNSSFCSDCLAKLLSEKIKSE